MIVVKKDLGNKIMVNHKTNLIYHSYFILLEIRKLDSQSKKSRRKTDVVNIYNNCVRGGCTRNGGIQSIKQTLEHIK